jgi:UrcA family protein
MLKFLIASSLLGAVIPPAHAQQASVSVGYADLDLTSASGVQRLDRRIDAAIRKVCGERTGQKPLSTMLAIRRCDRLARGDVDAPRRVAIARARGQVPGVELASAGHSFAVVARRR